MLGIEVYHKGEGVLVVGGVSEYTSKRFFVRCCHMDASLGIMAGECLTLMNTHCQCHICLILLFQVVGLHLLPPG